ncbi:uncharacterized protein LOC142204580 [Leptodactylus fuscus]|uniref:uncharacterized protein LOC142204580 n=1 Tax=Leptodactylus fuscus TaxID=238119 RepID=UPI003F4EC271
MVPPPDEYSPVLRETQNFPESHRAGHFQLVAHMNMFDNESWTFRIPVKISLKLSVEDTDRAGLGDKKINASDPARESDVCSKLIEQVKRDVHLSDGEEKSRQKSSTSSRSSTKEKRKERREEDTNIMQVQKDKDVEWAKAKVKVEEFLDFPGVMAAMAYRNQGKAKGSSKNASNSGGELASRCQADPIPNTKHNAIFLRDHEKAAEAILLNPQYQKVNQPQAVNMPQSTKSRVHGKKMAEKPDSIVVESNNGTDR